MYQQNKDVFEEYFAREKAEKSLYEFTKQAWHVVEHKPFVGGWYLEGLCEHLEACVNRQIKSLLVNVPPRTLKTTIISVMFPAWVWLNRPWEQFLYTAYGSDLSTDASRKTRMVISSPWYQARWGDRFKLLGDQNAKHRFDNDKTGYRMATSVNSMMTGFGGSFNILDDPNNASESQSVSDRTNQFLSGSWGTRSNDFHTDIRILAAQRLKEKDASGHILSNDVDREWVRYIVPMEHEGHRRCVTVPLPSTNGKPWQDPRTKEGELISEERFGGNALKRLKNALGSEYLISAQLQQNPRASEGDIIKKNWFSHWKKPNPPKIIQTIQSWDLALKDGEQNSYSACTTWGLFRDDNKYYNLILLGMYREKAQYPELRAMAKRLYRDYRDDGNIEIKPDRNHTPDLVIIESKVSGISLLQDFMRAGIPVMAFDPTRLGDKIERVRLISHFIEAGRLWLPAKPPDYGRLRPFADKFVELCSIFPDSESLDVVDTMTQVLHRLKMTGFMTHPDDEQFLDTSLKSPSVPLY